MLSPKKLNNIDFSSLKENPDNLFTLRFQDMNKESQRVLATRIKETAPQYTLRKANGPSIETICEALTEINPIIFSEFQPSNERNNWYPRTSYKNFNYSQTHYISGYRYHNLCQAIYYTICLKKPLHRDKILTIARTINSNWRITAQFIDRYSPQPNTTETQNQEPNMPTNEIGLEDIERVRISVEANGANNIPEEMREITPQDIQYLQRLKINLNPAITLDELENSLINN